MSNSIPYIARKQAQDFLAKFDKALESPESNPLLFQIYGFGGVGKTTLTRKLKEEYDSEADFAEVSFGLTPGIETPLKLMEELYKLLPKSASLLRKDVVDIRPSDLLPKSDPFTPLYEQYKQTVYKLKTQPVEGKTVDTKQQTTVKDWFELGTITALAVGTNYVDPLNCFYWLTQCDFVEFIQGRYRLDDVARDVFRLSLYQEDKNQFRETHELLAKYFEQQANQEVSADSLPPEKYENADWRQFTAEFLYHALFARRGDPLQNLKILPNFSIILETVTIRKETALSHYL